jgi:hypothetical protein
MARRRAGGAIVSEMTLEPCPFCGSEAEFVSDCMGGKYVMCTHPGCQATCRYSGQPDKAIAAWNRRAHIAQHAEMVAKLRDVTKGMRTVSRLAGEHDLRLRDTSAAWADQIDAALLDAQPATNVSESSSKLVDAQPAGEPSQAVAVIRDQVSALLHMCAGIANDINKSEGEDYLALSARLMTILRSALSTRRGFTWLYSAPPAAAVSEDARDAARYRWLRDVGQETVEVYFATNRNPTGWGCWDSWDDKDAAVDLAMTGESHE